MANENSFNGKIEANLNGLDDILKGLMKDYRLRVGIIGSDATESHKNSSLTKAQIGRIHEFGANINVTQKMKGYFFYNYGIHLKKQVIKIPKRSFLLAPLEHNLDFTSSEMKPMRKVLFAQFFDKHSPKKFFDELGQKALDIINEAFDTQGWSGGAGWAPLSKLAIENRYTKSMSNKKKEDLNHNHAILQNTGQLKDSISFKVFRNR